MLAILFVVSGVVGWFWLRTRWFVAAGIFWAIELLFFTTFLTNGQGIGTGLIGSLGYWIDQQEVMRGGQPWYYFWVLVPLYEFLPLLLEHRRRSWRGSSGRIAAGRRRTEGGGRGLHRARRDSALSSCRREGAAGSGPVSASRRSSRRSWSSGWWPPGWSSPTWARRWPGTSSTSPPRWRCWAAGGLAGCIDGIDWRAGAQAWRLLADGAWCRCS